MAVKIQVESLPKEYRKKLCERTLTKGTVERLAKEVSEKYLLQRKAFRRAVLLYAVIVILLAVMTFLSPAAVKGSMTAVIVSLGFLAALGIMIFWAVYFAVVMRIPRQFVRCLKRGYPELEMLYGYEMIISGKAAVERKTQQLPFSMQIEDVFRLQDSDNIVVAGFAHGLIAKGNSVFLIDKNDSHRRKAAAIVNRIEIEGGKPAAQALDCYAALEIIDGGKYDLRAGMYLYREHTL
mgnify:CR=1 FL=1